MRRLTGSHRLNWGEYETGVGALKLAAGSTRNVPPGTLTNPYRATKTGFWPETVASLISVTGSAHGKESGLAGELEGLALPSGPTLPRGVRARRVPTRTRTSNTARATARTPIAAGYSRRRAVLPGP